MNLIKLKEPDSKEPIHINADHILSLEPTVYFEKKITHISTIKPGKHFNVVETPKEIEKLIEAKKKDNARIVALIK